MSDEIDPKEIGDQLNRILGSNEFKAGPRVGKFLTHIVTEELEGRGASLKGTAIAMDVFGRGVDFDPNYDPVVRVEAGKLRSALEFYYLSGGIDDTVEIVVPKGRYRPEFRRRQPESGARAAINLPTLPSLLIQPFSGTDADAARLYCDGLPEEIGLEMARFGQIQVLSGWTNAAGTASSLQHDYALSGVVREAGGNLRINIQLTRQPDNALVWSERFRVEDTETKVFDLQEAIARQVAVRIADAYGVLESDLGARYSGRQIEDAGVFEALLAFHTYLRRFSTDGLHNFRDLANSALRDNPGSGLANALVAISLVEMVALGHAGASDILERGSGIAETAVELAPHCQEALFAAAIYACLKGQKDRFHSLVTKALAANPNGTLIAAQAGMWIVIAGDIPKGVALTRDARERNPLLPAWTELNIALGELVEGRYEEAASRYRNTEFRDSVFDWISAAAAYEAAGDRYAAEQAIAHLTGKGIDIAKYIAGLPMDERLRSIFSPVVELSKRA